MENKKHAINEYCNKVAPLFIMMFPLMHSIKILASKMECKAYRYKLKCKREQKRDLTQIEDTAKRLKNLCEQYTEKYLYTPDITESERDRADMVILNDSNKFVYYAMRLQNVLISGATEEDYVKIDSAFKLAAKNKIEHESLEEELIQEFNIK